MSKAIGNLHRCTVSPERGISSIGHVVVKNNEVPNVVHFKLHLLIEFVNVGRSNTVMREHLQQPDHASLDQMNTGRFKRLHKTTREPHSHAVLLPVSSTGSGLEADHARIGDVFPLNVAQQLLGRLIL